MIEENLKLANLIFPQILPTPEELELKFPPRRLPEGAMVTRLAPSPTGFIHIGTVYSALLNHKLARQTKGIFFLRQEDTDKKREVEGAVELVVQSLAEFGVIADEGLTLSGEKGDYGPYTQSKRAEVYHAFAKQMLAEGKAYACFCTPEELEVISQKQSQMKLKPGYYKDWAIWRNKPIEEVEKALLEGKKATMVIRFRNEGNSIKRNKIEDLIKGKLELPEDDSDIVLIKSDGLPTYHFAHLIDDHLMRTTHVIRGDEWFASLPLHLQLFKVMGWTAPKYAHIAPIQKLDEGNRRKLSKRKDPEASVSYYFHQGYPVSGIIEYLLTVADSTFEPWRKQNPDLPLTDYELKIKNIGNSGALLDFKKLDNICTRHVGQLSPEQTYDLVLAWAQDHDPELSKLMSNRDYWLAILGLEKDNPNQRKDLAKWADVKSYYGFFIDQFYQNIDWDLAVLMPNTLLETQKLACQKYLEVFNPSDSKETWLSKVKNIAEELGYAPEVKLFKESPDKYKGHFGEITQIYRIILTGRAQSPDLYEIIRVLGKDKTVERLEAFLKK